MPYKNIGWINLGAVKCFSFILHQGGDVSSFPENYNPGEGFQTGSTEERAGEGHKADGEVIT